MRIRLKHRELARRIAESHRSQSAWARKLGLSPAYLSRLVNGKRPFPSPDTRGKLLREFALEFDELFEVEHRVAPPRSPSPVRTGLELEPGAKGLEMSQLGKDLLFALRMMARKPFFASLVVLALVLGIGANVAVYSLLDFAFLRPLPFPRGEELVAIWNLHGIGQTATSPLELRLFQDSGVSKQMGAFSKQNYQLLTGGDPLRVSSAEVTVDLLPILVAAPWKGRFFNQDEFSEGKNRVVISTWDFFESRFGGDQDLVGHMIEFGKGEFQLVGVLPPGFEFPWQAQLFFPLVIPGSMYGDEEWGQEYLHILARLADQVSLEQARNRLNELLEQQVPERVARGQRISLIPLREELLGETRPALTSLFAASLFVFLIACANVANLFLVRAEGRKDEFAVRMALGAGWPRMFRQLLCESTLLSLLGSIGGFVLASSLLRLINSLPVEELVPLKGAGLDWPVMAFGVALTVTTSLIFGLIPSFQVTRRPLSETLKLAASRSTTGHHMQRLRASLVVAEVALAIALAMAVTILLQSFQHLRSQDPGFNSGAILSGRVELPPDRYPPAQRGLFYDQLTESLEAHSEVEKVATAYAVPLDGIAWSASFAIVGRVSDPNAPEPSANIRPVSNGFFSLMSIPLKEGRLFSQEDRPGSAVSVIIDEALARSFWPDGEAVGARISDTIFGDREATIVGVVGNVRDTALSVESKGHLYFSLDQFRASGQRAVLLETRDGLENLPALLRQEVQRLDPTLPVFDLQTFDERINDSVAGRRLSLLLVGGFAALALLLAAIGVYGLTAYSVGKRTGELGIRMALGARSREIIGMVLREALWLWVCGAVLGWLLAYAGSGLLRQFVYQVSSTDPLSFAAVALLLGLLTLFAAGLPAWRAASSSCLDALRYE